MKKMIALITLGLWSATALALDFDAAMENAQKLFVERSATAEGIAKAQASADAYKALATNEALSLDQRAQAYAGAAESTYFVGTHQDSDEKKEKIHEAGYTFAKNGFALLEDPESEGQATNEEFEETLGLNYYWYGANLGKWAEARGILQSLSRWPELRKYMTFILDLGLEDLADYGANRILGRAYYKLPFPMGSKKKSLTFLKEAFENTIEDEEANISNWGVTCNFYAETLIAIGQKDEARRILETLISMGESEEKLAEYNEDRIPETKVEIEDAKKILGTL